MHGSVSPQLGPFLAVQTGPSYQALTVCVWHAEGTNHAQPLDCNLGLLLIDYFRFFGRQLAVTKIGVACGGATHASGCYVKAQVFQKGGDFRDKGDRLSIRDPLDDSNDVSRCAARVLLFLFLAVFLLSLPFSRVRPLKNSSAAAAAAAACVFVCVCVCGFVVMHAL